MKKQAWQLEREFRDAAVPVDRRVTPSKWEQGGEFPHGDALLRWFWNVQVPGSLAPDVFFQGMIQDWANQGYDVSEAEAMVPEGRMLEAAGRIMSRVLSARIMKCLWMLLIEVHIMLTSILHLGCVLPCPQRSRPPDWNIDMRPNLPGW
jgi:hypothetical protein